MGIRLATFQQHQLTAQDYALLCAKSVSSGIFYGCNVTIKDESTLHVTSGVGIANGRTFDVTDDDYPVELTGGGSMVGRIYVHVDLADVDTPAQILVVKGATLPPLVQDSDMNESTGVWDLELATFDVDASEISNLVYTASGVSGGGGGTMLAPYYDASEAWLKDQIFQKDGVLYKCLADIAVGAPLVVGTNVKVTDFAEETEALNQNLTNFSTELTTLISGTIAANATSTTISDDKIHTTSIIDVYFADAVPSVTGISVAEGSCTISITKRNVATGVSIRVLNGGV